MRPSVRSALCGQHARPPLAAGKVVAAIIRSGVKPPAASVWIQRDALQRAMGPQLIAAVERLTRRTVRTFLSGSDKDGASAIEAFVLESEPPEAAAPNVD